MAFSDHPSALCRFLPVPNRDGLVDRVPSTEPDRRRLTPDVHRDRRGALWHVLDVVTDRTADAGGRAERELEAADGRVLGSRQILVILVAGSSGG